MCGRYDLIVNVQALAARFNASLEAPAAGKDGEELRDWQPRYNIAPGQRNPVVVAGEQGEDRHLALMKWGLVPGWAKEPKTSFSMINARAETVTHKPSFRKPFMSRRCLVPATGYFEWAEEDGGQGKQPYRLQARALGEVGAGEAGHEAIVALAGLYDVWRGPEGEELYTYTIVTTQASPGLEALHPRMPVILTREVEDVWLDTSVKDAERLMGLLVPYPSEKLKVYPVSSAVNSPRNDRPAVVQAI